MRQTEKAKIQSTGKKKSGGGGTAGSVSGMRFPYESYPPTYLNILRQSILQELVPWESIPREILL